MTPAPDPPVLPLLQVRNLSKFYGASMGCNDINFEMEQGEVIGIAGESGAGKSTLLSCIAGNTPPTNGAVRFNAASGMVDMCRCPEAVRRKIARTQTGFIQGRTAGAGPGQPLNHPHAAPSHMAPLYMDLTAGANVGARLMAGGMRNFRQIRAIAGEWIERVGISVDRIDEPPREFSPGQQMRLRLAAVLVTDPKLLLLDEPFAGLDPGVKTRLTLLMRQLARESGLSMALATCDLAMARLLCHRLIILKNGRVVESGLTGQVLDDPRHPHTQVLAASTAGHDN